MNVNTQYIDTTRKLPVETKNGVRCEEEFGRLIKRETKKQRGQREKERVTWVSGVRMATDFTKEGRSPSP